MTNPGADVSLSPGVRFGNRECTLVSGGRILQVLGRVSPTGGTVTTLRTRVLAVSHEATFLHLIQTVLEDVGLPVRTTCEWAGVPLRAVKLRPELVILDLAPGYEAVCWLALEALRANPLTRHVGILLCPIAPWLVDGHKRQVERQGARVWSGNFELQELLGHVVAVVP